MADLIDQTTLTSLLGPLNLSAAQVALYPTLAPAASAAIRRWCGRWFNRRTAIDELYTLDPQGNTILLREMPVNGVSRLAATPYAVLTVTNTSASTTRAAVQLTTTGDVDGGLVVTGLTLRRVSAGTTTDNTVTFSANQTIASAAAAVNAVGSGWSATADSRYANWPVADLRAPQGFLPAVSPANAELCIHVDDVPFSLDEQTGMVYLTGISTDNPWTSTKWGPPYSTEYGDQRIRGKPLGVRVVYDAGYATVPTDVQQACAMAVGDWAILLSRDPRVSSESVGDYSYSVAPLLNTYHLPPAVLGIIAPYRLVHV